MWSSLSPIGGQNMHDTIEVESNKQSRAIQSAFHKTEMQTKLGCRLALAQTCLTKNSTSTPCAQTVNDPTLSLRAKDLDHDLSKAWRVDLLKTVMTIEPQAFERLCQRILRASGFKSVMITGRTHDGGIDGVGLLALNLITFSVAFQCKRYVGCVRARDIRDFRGALEGHSEKGLFITTGRFTADAVKEASRQGVRRIDLVNGERLCDLLKELSLGVSTQTVEEIRVDDDWFKHI